MKPWAKQAIRIVAELLILAVGAILGAAVALRIRGPTMGLDERILFAYVLPGTAGGLFLSVMVVLFFRKVLSLATACGLLLGAAAGTGLSVWFWRHVWEFEPPGNDLAFMFLYFTLSALGGMVLGFFVSAKAARHV